MSELAISPTMINVVGRSDNIIISPIVANGVSSLSMSVGTNALAAFTGTAAFEKFSIVFKTPKEIEALINLGATTASVALYRNTTLIAQTAPVLGFQSIGTLAPNTTYTMTVTSSVLIAANAFIFSMSARQTFNFNTYFTSNSPRPITGMTVSTNPTNGTPIYNFNNASITMNPVGKAEVDIFYNAIANNTMSFTTSANASGNSLTSTFPPATLPTQTFTNGDNIAVVLSGIPNFTYTGINGTLTIGIPNLGVANFVYMTNTSYIGQVDPITPFNAYLAIPEGYQRNRVNKTSICEMDINEEKQDQLAIKEKATEEYAILQ
jgi:hypothetical protein